MEDETITEEDRLALENAELRVQLVAQQRQAVFERIYARYDMERDDRIDGRKILRAAKLEVVEGKAG